jgi:MFS transporter, putative metabolite:H+ symporter
MSERGGGALTLAPPRVPQTLDEGMTNTQMRSGAAAGAADEAASLIARLERLPFSRFHVRALTTVGLAHMFDAFDALAVAFILPSLSAEWHISTLQIGVLISINYVGQLIGSVAMSAVAERLGRRRALRLVLFILSLLSLACAFAPGYLTLLLLRFLQGIGLGGEVPIAASYLNELCPARFRGRVIYVLQALFASGTLLTAVAAVPMIPRYGWQSMFVIGTLPLVLAIFLNRLVPESPRWLIGRGRTAEARSSVAAIESEIQAGGVSLPPVGPLPASTPVAHGASFRELFANGYARRTLSVWVLALCTSLAGYGILSWMPTLYTRIYKLPLHESLVYSLAPGAASIAGALVGSMIIESLGRRRSFTLGFLGGALPLFYLAFAGSSAFIVMCMSGISMFFLVLLLSGIYLYAPEIYPTRIRALGTGVATAWMRVASIVGPLIVSLLITRLSVSAVFMFFACAALLGALVVALFLIETAGRSLEQIAA